MKVTWEPEDIRCGRIMNTPNAEEQWMIGYNPMIDTMAMYTIISLSDGMIGCEPTTRSLLAQLLNQGKYIPEELIKK